MDLIAQYFNGWEYLLPAILVAASTTSYLLHSTRRLFAPWGIIFPWLGLFVAMYVATDTGKYLGNEKVAWLAITTVYLLLTALPVGVVAAYIHSAHGRRQRAHESALIGIAIGVLCIPLLHVIYRQAAILLFRFVPIG